MCCVVFLCFRLFVLCFVVALAALVVLVLSVKVAVACFVLS